MRTATKPAFLLAEESLSLAPDYAKDYTSKLRSNAAEWKKRLSRYLGVLRNLCDSNTFEPHDKHWGACKGNAEWLQRGALYSIGFALECLSKAKDPADLGKMLTGDSFADWLTGRHWIFTDKSGKYRSLGWPQTQEKHHLVLFDKGATFAATTILGVLYAQQATDEGTSKS